MQSLHSDVLEMFLTQQNMWQWCDVYEQFVTKWNHMTVNWNDVTMIWYDMTAMSEQYWLYTVHAIKWLYTYVPCHVT